MLRLLVVFSLVLLSPFAGAQAKDSREALNKQAIDALQAKKYDEGIALFNRILELAPKDKGTAYNLACANSLKGDVDKAFEWLDKAAEWGWGESEGQIFGREGRLSETEMLKQDADLENVRKDPRFEKFVEKLAKAGEVLEARKKKGEAYSATAAIYIPEKAKGMAEMPVLIVLHDQASTKDAVVAGRWKAIADELGFALIAPSGKLLLGDEPEKGMTWFTDYPGYKAKYWTFEKPVTDACSAFKKEHPIDKTRVVIAGEGLGALVALNVAIGNPGLIKGAVLLNGGLNADLMAAKAPSAGKMGLRAAILMESAALDKLMTDAGQKPEDGTKLVADWSKTLQTWGIQGEAKRVDASNQAMIVEAVKAVLARDPAAAPAAAPKAEEPKK